jgi:hypothetical protein
MPDHGYALALSILSFLWGQAKDKDLFPCGKESVAQ